MAYTTRDNLRPGKPKPKGRVVSHPVLAASVAATVYVSVLIGGRGVTPSTHPIGRFFDPDSPITIAILLLVVGWAIHSCVSKLSPRYRGIVVTSTIALLALILGVAGYWRENRGQSDFWTPLARAANLFVGEVEYQSGTLSLALQVARVGAAISMFSAAFTAFAAATRDHGVLLRVQREREVVLVWRLNTHSLDVVRALRAALHPCTVIVVLEPDANHAMKQQAQNLGAYVVAGTIDRDLRTREILKKIVLHQTIGSRSLTLATHWKKPTDAVALRAAYLLDQHDIRNIEAAEILESILPEISQSCPADVPPRIIVRIDRVRLAQDFLRRKVFNRPAAFYDTTGLQQMTAREVVDHVIDQSPVYVVITGNTDLTLAFLHEWTIQCELQAFLRWARISHAWNKAVNEFFRDHPRSPLASIVASLPEDSFLRLVPDLDDRRALHAYAEGQASEKIQRAASTAADRSQEIWESRRLPAGGFTQLVIDSLGAHLPSLDTDYLADLLGQTLRDVLPLESDPDASLIQLVLLDPQADEILEQHQQLLSGREGSIPITAVCGAPTVEALEAVFTQSPSRRAGLRDCLRDAMVRTETPSSTLSQEIEVWAERLSDDCIIYFPTQLAGGVSPQPLMGNLRAYGDTLTARQSGAPDAPQLNPPQPCLRQVEDNWLRAAKQLHEAYRALYGTESWDELGQTKRQSNLRAIRSFLILAQRVGRTWVPTGGSSPAPLTDEELEEIAEFEHQSWFDFMVAHCTAYGEVRDDAKRVNPMLKAWDEADAESRRRTLFGLQMTQGLLAALGFRPYQGTPVDSRE